MRVAQGKGAKDRLVPISATLLQALRAYWRRVRPPVWLFTQANHRAHALGVTSCQEAFRYFKQTAGETKGVE